MKGIMLSYVEYLEHRRSNAEYLFVCLTHVVFCPSSIDKGCNFFLSMVATLE